MKGTFLIRQPSRHPISKLSKKQANCCVHKPNVNGYKYRPVPFNATMSGMIQENCTIVYHHPIQVELKGWTFWWPFLIGLLTGVLGWVGAIIIRRRTKLWRRQSRFFKTRSRVTIESSKCLPTNPLFLETKQCFYQQNKSSTFWFKGGTTDTWRVMQPPTSEKAVRKNINKQHPPPQPSPRLNNLPFIIFFVGVD